MELQLCCHGSGIFPCQACKLQLPIILFLIRANSIGRFVGSRAEVHFWKFLDNSNTCFSFAVWKTPQYPDFRCLLLVAWFVPPQYCKIRTQLKQFNYPIIRTCCGNKAPLHIPLTAPGSAPDPLNLESL